MFNEAKSTYGGYAKFLGQRNEAQSRRQPKGDAETGERLIALAQSNNIDVDDEGGIISRPGYALTQTGTSITAAYATRDYQHLYIVDSGILKRIHPSQDTLVLGAVATDDTYWVEVGNKVFMSTGFVVEGDTLLNWRVQPPDMPKAEIVGGSLSAGQYQVVTTYVTPDGRETGTSIPLSLDVPDQGGIRITNIDPSWRVYVTGMNGDIFYLVGDGVEYITDVTSLNYPIDDSLIMASALPANVGPIAYYDSCLYYSVYDGVNNVTLIGWSNPFRWHTFDLFNDYIQVPGEVRLLVGYEDALLIGTDKEIMQYNGEQVQRLARYGVPKGHNYALTRDNVLLFQTARGVCTMPFKNLSGDKVALPVGNYVSSGLVDMNGMEKFITVTDGTGVPDNSTVF